uniref:Reverse transcriptase zinc-binding domain-containing protein n=1 Tax=Lactuca sativa TaxID=4236 RepID=A0A9R1V6A3_LACSA|nr:hypothetical protein LSAT_V11C600303060 [Lactuca sativa]
MDKVLKWNWSWSWRIISRREFDQLSFLINTLNNVQFASGYDRWLWKGDDNISFLVIDFRILIGAFIDINAHSFKWVKWILLKVNFFVWRLIRNCIPLTPNLLSHGVYVSLTLCPFCRVDEDHLDHMFFSSPVPRDCGNGWWNGMKLLISILLTVWSYWRC